MSSEAPKEGVSKADEIAAVVAANNDGLGGMEDDDGDIPMTFPQRVSKMIVSRLCCIPMKLSLVLY